MTDEKLYRVAWQVKSTGATGHGEPLSREIAEAWVDHSNTTYPEVFHWIETLVGGQWYAVKEQS
jgi:hypothetical protein